MHTLRLLSDFERACNGCMLGAVLTVLVLNGRWCGWWLDWPGEPACAGPRSGLPARASSNRCSTCSHAHLRLCWCQPTDFEVPCCSIQCTVQLVR